MSGDDAGSTVAGWLGVAALTVCGAASAWVESLLVPYYVGSMIMPVTVVLALVGNWYLPRMARVLVPSTLAAALPFVAWLGVIFGFAASGTSEGDVILPGGGGATEYVGYAVMFGGALVGTLSIVSSAPLPERRRQPVSGSSR